MKDNSSTERLAMEEQLKETGFNLGRVTKDLDSLTAKLIAIENLHESATVAGKMKELEHNKKELE